jgi:predicted transcriptional regulator
LKHIPREQWKTKRVADIVNSCSSENVIDPETDIVKALSVMNRTGNSRLMVAEGDTLVGIITLKDVMNFLSIKLDLGEYEK